MVIMARRRPYALAFAAAVTQHLRAIAAKDHALIRAKIGEHLRFEPVTETTNRKPLRPPAPRPPGDRRGEPLRLPAAGAAQARRPFVLRYASHQQANRPAPLCSDRYHSLALRM
jgi:hypothetical protein